MLFIYRTVCSHSHAARRGAAPPPPRPLSPKEVTCVAHRTDFGCQPTPKSLVLLGRGEGVPKAWFSSVIDGKNTSLPVSRFCLPWQGPQRDRASTWGCPQGLRGLSASLKVSSPHPGCKKPSKGVTWPISSPLLILQEPNSHSKLNLGWGCYLCPFFFGVLEVQKAPQARRAASHRNARVRFFLHRRA